MCGTDRADRQTVLSDHIQALRGQANGPSSYTGKAVYTQQPRLSKMELNVAASILFYVFLVVACTVGTAFVVFTLFLYRFNRKYGHLPCPRPTGFFTGHLSHFNAVAKKLDFPPLLLMYQWTRELGPVFYLRFVLQPMVVCSDSKAVKEVCLDSRHLKPQSMYVGFYSVFGERFMGNGLVSQTDHEKWHTRRALLNPAFNRKYLMQMMDLFNDSATRLRDHLVPLADGKTLVKMLDHFNDVTLDVIAKVGFDMDINAVERPDCPFPSAVALALEGMDVIFKQPMMMVDPRSKARKYRRSVRDAIKLVRKFGKDCIEQRRAAKKRGEELPKDILTCILEVEDDLCNGQNIDTADMIDEFGTFFVAGQETTSNLLAFTLLESGRHEDVAKRLKAEVDEVLGNKPNIEYSDLPKLEYMSRVFKETMRLNPPVSGVIRGLACDVNSSGYVIPKGSNIFFGTYLTSRQEEYFDDPLLFNPDRFIPTDELPRHLYAYFPFAIGQRNCIGQQLALIESKVILAKLLQSFDFRLEQSQRHVLLSNVTNKPFDRCKNYISHRD
ncbi:cholesterol 24-hydroxylase-like [Lytechinus variegatus]|uniref:cholesterol 24-hydroxylase-like n=1 Tax=Lytechinus variegatus TaxID=7654 RepID=UPI001BB1F713|nr:cholesterol 24-hydroxylase-like [Lytechinus variegatus]